MLGFIIDSAVIIIGGTIAFVGGYVAAAATNFFLGGRNED